jgi:hypothetical protein
MDHNEIRECEELSSLFPLCPIKSRFFTLHFPSSQYELLPGHEDQHEESCASSLYVVAGLACDLVGGSNADADADANASTSKSFRFLTL